MKNLCLLAIAYCLLVFTFSCKPKTDYTNEISRLDSAAIRLKEASTAFSSSDTNAFRSVYTFSQEKLHGIYQTIAKDTLQKNTALFLSDASEHMSNLQNMLENKRFFEKAMTEGEQRIRDLKHDLEADLHEKNKSMEYVVNEINASQKLSEAVNKTIEKARSSATKLDSMKTRIEFLSDSLRSK